MLSAIEARVARNQAFNVDSIVILESFANYKAKGSMNELLNEALGLKLTLPIHLYPFVKPITLMHALDITLGDLDEPESIFTSKKTDLRVVYEETLKMLLGEYHIVISLMAHGILNTQLKNMGAKGAFSYFVSRDWPKVRELYNEEITSLNADIAVGALPKKNNPVSGDEQLRIEQAISQLTVESPSSLSEALVTVSKRAQVAIAKLDVEIVASANAKQLNSH